MRRHAPRSKAAPAKCCSASQAFGKAGLGRADFAVKPAEIARAAVDIGFIELVIRSDAAALVAELPAYHRDPFDRVLVAQAMVEPATLYTADDRLARYSESVRRIAAR